MEERRPVNRWSWLISSLLFLAAAITFQRVVALSDAWFVSLGRWAFTGLVFDMLAVFLAAFLAATVFMRRFGQDKARVRRLAFAYAATYAGWNLLSFLLVASLLHFAPVVWGLGGFALGEAAFGCFLVWAGVVARAYLIDRNFSRRTAAGVS